MPACPFAPYEIGEVTAVSPRWGLRIDVPRPRGFSRIYAGSSIGLRPATPAEIEAAKATVINLASPANVKV